MGNKKFWKQLWYQVMVEEITRGAAYKETEFVIIAAPTNYDSKKNFFDTSAVESVIELVMKVNPEAIMVIKSTILVGYTKSVREKYNTNKIIVSPKFLRESKTLYDNLYPSRIVVSCDEGTHEKAEIFVELLRKHRYAVCGIYRGRVSETVC